jgi:hypothetical protein
VGKFCAVDAKAGRVKAFSSMPGFQTSFSQSGRDPAIASSPRDGWNFEKVPFAKQKFKQPKRAKKRQTASPLESNPWKTKDYLPDKVFTILHSSMTLAASDSSSI